MSDIVILVHVDGLILQFVMLQIKSMEFIDMIKCLGWVRVTIRIIYKYTLRMNICSMIGIDIFTQRLYPHWGHQDIILFK